MADINENSIDVESDNVASSLTNKLESSAEEFARRSRDRESGELAVSLDAAVKKNPEQQARVSDLSESTGLPTDTVENKLPELEERERRLKLDVDEFMRRAPTTTRKVTNPVFAGMTHDDLENLVSIEESIRNKQLSFFDKAGKNFKKNVAVIEASEIGFKDLLGELKLGEGLSQDDRKRLVDLEPAMSFTHDTPFLAGIPIEAIGQVPFLFDVLAEGGVTAAAGATAGAIVGGVITKTPAGALKGAQIGGGAGLKIGAINAVFQIESGLAFTEFTSNDKNLVAVDRQVAAGGAVMVGAVNASLEFASLSLLGKTFKGAKPLIMREVKRLMATQSGRQVTKRILATYLAAAAGEGITEALQEVSLIFGKSLTESLSTGELNEESVRKAFAELATDESIDAISESAKVGFQAGAGLSAVGTTATIVSETTGTKNKSEVEQEKIDGLVDLIGSSKLRERSGRVFRQTIDDVVEEIETETGEVSNIYWTATEAQKWLESQGIDIDAPAENPAIESLIAQLPEAIASGNDVTLSIADFATDIAPAEGFEESIRAHIKLSPDALTIDENKNFDETVEKRIKKVIEVAQQNVEILRQSEQIFEQVKSQLIDTERLTPETASITAEIIPAYVTAKAARTGLSPEEVFRRMGLSIVGPSAPALEGGLTQLVDPLTFKSKRLEKVKADREKVDSRLEVVDSLLEQIDNVTDRFEGKGVDLTDDAAILRAITADRFSGAISQSTLFKLAEEVSDEAEPGPFQSFPLSDTGQKQTRESVVKSLRDVLSQKDALRIEQDDLQDQKESFDETVDFIFSGEDASTFKAKKERKIDADLEKILEEIADEESAKDGDVLKQDTRGEIKFDDDAQGAVIRLTEASDLTTFLHESGHLFLEMEKRFFNDPEISAEAKQDGQAILDWLEVKTFEDIGSEQHEKWARGFEAYLGEGKAPSAALRSTFRRFAAWIAQVYTNLRRLNVNLTPEIRNVMDRMLATDEQIEETKTELALEPLFKTAEEANMTPKEFSEYQAKTQGAAEEELRTKILGQLTRTTLKWWREELAAVQDEVRDEISNRALYRALAFMKAKDVPEGFEENKIDRLAAYRILGLAVPVEPRKGPRSVAPDVDSLGVAIAVLGGLNREDAAAQGVDPAHWRPVKKAKFKDGVKTLVSTPNPDNLPIGVGKPLFRKTGGRTFDEMREILSEMGYVAEDSTESDLLEILLEELSGNTQYSVFADLDKVFENPDELPKERFKAPAQLRGATKKGGLAPDTMAALFNFASGTELVRQLVETPTINVAVEREANAVMVQRHGDILNDGTLDQAAREAAHNTEQGSALLDELRALSGQTNVQAISEAKTIKAAAARIIGQKAISSLRPATYRAAEVKAAKESQAAVDSGDLVAAQEAKQRQLFNFHLWREATSARETGEKIRNKLSAIERKRFSKRDVNPEHVSRVKQLLAAYDFRKSNAQARRSSQAELSSVRSWIAEQQNDVNSPANIVNATALDKIVHYRDMNLDQLQAVRDVATSLLHAGRKNSLQEKDAFKENMKLVAENIGDISTKVSNLEIEGTAFRQVKQWGRAVLAAHRKLESLARQLDGLQDLGPVWKLLIQPLLRANNKKLEMQNKAHDDLNDIFFEHEGMFNTFHDRQKFELESGKEITLSLGARISVALNWGNEGNREAITNMESNKMTETDVETILATLTDADWNLVEDAWDYVDSFWPQIKELEKSFTGVAPRKVEAKEFKTQSGRTMRGGYYPLVADTTLGLRARQDEIEKRADRLKQGGSISAATQHGHTIERTQFGGRDIELSINVLFRHVDNVIHDLTHRQAVNDVDRVLRNRDFRKAAKAAIGSEALQTMTARVTEVAAGHIHPQELGAIERGLRYMRLSLTYASLGFSVKTGFSQLLGTGTAIGELGQSNVARGFIDFYSNPIQNEKFINENSVFMRDRITTVNRDTGEILRSLKGKSKLNTLRENAFQILLMGDLAVSRPVWWAAYSMGMERVGDSKEANFDNEQDAIDFADRAVSRTQQSGLLMDLAAVESKNEFVKMWTVMFSAFSAIYQIANEQTKKYQLGKIDKVQLAQNIVWILVIPPLFEELMTGRKDEDDEDDGVINNRWTRSVASFSLGTMAFLREVGWIMQSGRNSQLPVQKVLATIPNAVRQVDQAIEEKEIDGATIKALTDILALGLIPGGAQLNRSMNYWLAYEEGDEEHFDVWEFLVTGPREDE